jgi:pimeloyl-ACP methyl ester carboxylesterase
MDSVTAGMIVDPDAKRATARLRAPEPFLFGPPTHSLFGWFHAPAAEAARGAGVVLCNTIGNESLRAFVTLRHIAEALAAAGFAVLRFDFHGTGDSAGTEAEPGRVATWLDDIDLAIDELRARSGVREVGLAGLRLGGTLALAAAARRDDIEALYAWDPHYRGKDFVTESNRLHKTLVMLDLSGFALKRPGALDGLEALGFFLSSATIAELQQLDLAAVVDRAPAKHVLVAGSASAQKRGGDALVTQLRTLKTAAEYEVLGEHLNRNLRLVTERDHQNIAADITRWFDSHLAGTTDPARQGAVAPSALGATSGRADLSEEPVLFGRGRSLFGILTHPEAEPHGRGATSRPPIILVNAGPGTRIGPHRQYVRMAREWAKLGFATLRVDLSGSGDSTGPDDVPAGSPYPHCAIADVSAAMDLLQAKLGARRFIVAGICSGADIAFRAGVEEPRAAGVLVLNPRTFALFNIPTLEQMVRVQSLSATVSRKSNWIKLLRGDAGLKGSMTRIVQLAKTASVSAKQKLRALILRQAPNGAPIVDVPADMQRLLDRGVETLLLVGERDVGIMHVEFHFRKEMKALERHRRFHRLTITGVDHLFTSLYAQDVMIEAVTKHLLLVHPAPGQPSVPAALRDAPGAAP